MERFVTVVVRPERIEKQLASYVRKFDNPEEFFAGHEGQYIAVRGRTIVGNGSSPTALRQELELTGEKDALTLWVSGETLAKVFGQGRGFKKVATGRSKKE